MSEEKERNIAASSLIEGFFLGESHDFEKLNARLEVLGQNFRIDPVEKDEGTPQ